MSDLTHEESFAEDRFLLLHPADNILVCIRSATAGQSVLIDGQVVVLAGAIELGHKVARTNLKVGDKVRRYGAPIGTMTAAAAIGQHVHSHNLVSDYIPAHGRDAAQSEEPRS